MVKQLPAGRPDEPGVTVKDRPSELAPGHATDRHRRTTAPTATGLGLRGGGWFALPAVVVYLLFNIVPLLHAGGLSFFEWDGVTSPTFIGLDNYSYILFDEQLRSSFVHAFVLIIFWSLLPIFFGLALTGLLSRRPLPGMTTFKAILFLPQIIAAVVIGVAWRWMYQLDGPINRAVDSLGIASPHPWLADFDTALPAVGLIGTWVMTGLTTVLFMSGVQKIPLELYDAAKVDGAGPVREFFAITRPLLRREIAVALVFTVAVAMKVFGLIYVTTAGGPGTQTSVPAFEIYRRAFVTGQVGLAAAVGVVLVVVVLALTYGIQRLAESSEDH